MTFQEPLKAFIAANNPEAHLVCNLLQNSGVNALVVEDVTQVGTWMLGMVSQIHKPEVWIDGVDRERAQTILAGYERRTAELNGRNSDGPPIEIMCDACGRVVMFPAAQAGTVQNCPRCLAFLDVGEDSMSDEWQVTPEEASS